jgi:hypothetical protein
METGDFDPFDPPIAFDDIDEEPMHIIDATTSSEPEHDDGLEVLPFNSCGTAPAPASYDKILSSIRRTWPIDTTRQYRD